MVVKKLIVALTMTAMLASASGVAHVGSGASDVRRFSDGSNLPWRCWSAQSSSRAVTW